MLRIIDRNATDTPKDEPAAEDLLVALDDVLAGEEDSLPLRVRLASGTELAIGRDGSYLHLVVVGDRTSTISMGGDPIEVPRTE